MARDAGRKLLALMVRLMAIETGRLVAMGRMALLATELRVLARIFRKLILRIGVAFTTGIQ